MVWGNEFIKRHNDIVYMCLFVIMFLLRKKCFQNQQEWYVKSTLVMGIKHVKAGNTLYKKTKSVYKANLNAPTSVLLSTKKLGAIEICLRTIFWFSFKNSWNMSDKHFNMAQAARCEPTMEKQENKLKWESDWLTFTYALP